MLRIESGGEGGVGLARDLLERDGPAVQPGRVCLGLGEALYLADQAAQA
jgi:hypothetical protein